MRFKSGKEFLSLPNKPVTVLGMSGVGKTTLSAMLQKHDWFQYSVDYRIGTRYMDEHIVDNFKREAMTNPFLCSLLRSDSISIHSNITFHNLAPLSTYLGRPGNPAKGGIPFAEYKRRQNQHRQAEIMSLLDVPEFIERAADIYKFQNFICDSGGSLCEVVNLSDSGDPVLKSLSQHTVLIYIEGTPEHTAMLVERFRQSPKPMYYQPKFLTEKWAEYKDLNKIKNDDEVDPDGFAVWGFEQLVHHRVPLYKRIADQYGYTMRMQDVPSIHTEADFISHVASLIDKV